MRKLVLKMSVSVDGFVGGPNGEIDRLLGAMDASALDWVERTLWQAGVHIMGSRTFHDMAAYWPTSSGSLAAPMNTIPKLVFSKKGFVEPTDDALTTQALKDATRLDQEKGIGRAGLSPDAASWTNASVASDLVGAITKLKQEPGNFILAHGGAGFSRELIKSGLIDEYRLLIHPVILGKGLPLFSSILSPIDLILESSSRLDTGILANIYKA